MLSADFSRLREELDGIEAVGVEMVHLDVMDGHFAPNLTFGPPVIASLRPRSKLFFDAHLMIEEPARYAEAFAKAGCDLLNFHIEVADDPKGLVDLIHGLGCACGVTLNPTTPADAIDAIVDRVELVLVMSVWPGFSGQKFIPDVLPKVEAIRPRLAAHQRLQMDGGVDLDTIPCCVSAGADTFVAGSAVFGRPDPPQAARALLEKAREAGERG